MKRPAGVILSAIVVLLASVGFVAICVLTATVLFVTETGTPMPPEAKLGVMIGFGLFAVVGIWGAVTAIGLLRLRNWARISIIVFAALAVLQALVTVPTMFVIPRPANAPAGFATVLHVVAAVYAAIGLLGAAWLWYFNRRATRDAFAGAALSESARPLSISIVGWWLLITGAISLPVLLVLRFPAAIAIWTVNGWLAKVWYAAYAAALCYAGYGLLKLSRTARFVAIGLLSLGAVNGALFYGWPGREARVATLMTANRFTFQQQAPPPMPPPMFFVFIIAVSFGVPLWFIVTRRAAFVGR